MSDSVKFDWFDAIKTGGTAIATAVVGVLVRLLFGRAMKGIDDKLEALQKGNDQQTREVHELRRELAGLVVDVAVLQNEIENLKRLPAPAVTPR